MKYELLGVHQVDEAPDPCHLIELRLIPEQPGETLDLALVSQESADEHDAPGGWQKPYDPHLLDVEGTAGRPLAGSDGGDGGDGGEHWIVTAPARVAFFFHFLRLDRPLLTPGGPRLLPRPTPRPARLAFLKYSL
jgi:hypothetical protein